MVERTRIGNSAFGVPGLYVSQPGDNVAAPTQPLLFDSRYDALELHYTARVNFPEIDNTAGYRAYQAQVNFPDLGYVPHITFGVAHKVYNEIYYPPGMVRINDNEYPYYAFGGDVSLQVTSNYVRHMIRIPGVFRALDFVVAVYRNPLTPTVLPPSGTERVFIGNDAGTFKMRVSKPGYWARSASRDQCLVHEDKRPLIPIAAGTVNVPAGVDAVVGTGRSYAFPPKILTNGVVGLNLGNGNITFYGGDNAYTAKYVVYHVD